MSYVSIIYAMSYMYVSILKKKHTLKNISSLVKVGGKNSIQVKFSLINTLQICKRKIGSQKCNNNKL